MLQNIKLLVTIMIYQRVRHRTLSWIAWSLLVMVSGSQVVSGQEQDRCGHPPVPAGASYVNVTGGLGQNSWVVRYICDTGKNIKY